MDKCLVIVAGVMLPWHTFLLRMQLNAFFYIHSIKITTDLNMHLLSTIIYYLLCVIHVSHAATLPLLLSVSDFFWLLEDKRKCLHELLEDTMHHISKYQRFCFSDDLQIHARVRVEWGGGVFGKRPPGHQSLQSSQQWQVEGLWHFWLAWLMCFWSARGSRCQPKFLTQSRSHTTMKHFYF